MFGSQDSDWALHKDTWYRGKFELYLSKLGFRCLQFSHSEWRDCVNVTVVAFKKKPFMSPDGLVRAAEQLLRMSLVDDSESEDRLLRVWISLLVSRNESESPGYGLR